MTRASTLLSVSILIGAALVAGALISSPAGATRAQDAANGAVAYVDVYDIVDIIIMGDEATKARDDYEADSQGRIASLEEQLTTMQEQLQGLDPQSAEASELYSQYQRLAQVYQQTNSSINQGYQELLSGQIADAYVKIHDTVNEIANEQGYTYVLATRRGTDLVQTSSLTGVTQEILARPLVTPSEGVDLTDRVRDRMGLPTLEEVMENIDEDEALPPGMVPGVGGGDPAGQQNAEDANGNTGGGDGGE